MEQTAELNGVNVSKMLAFKNMCQDDATKGDNNPKLFANWIGGCRSRVEFKNGALEFGGPGELNAMQLVLTALAVCDIDLVAVHASFLGLKIENLSVEATGHFNLQSYLGLEAESGSGYDKIDYTVRVSVPGATPGQLENLRERCERSSPVRDSLTRAIPLKLEFAANA
ncbi:MAG: OsmC family protein [Gemmatimonadaceae bacterium]